MPPPTTHPLFTCTPPKERKKLLVIIRFYSSSSFKFFSADLKVATVCESYLMNLDCTNGEVLDIIEANYGRQDKTTCSDAFSWIEKKHLENTNCVSKSSKEKTTMQCQGKPSCKLPSKNSFFGDPCGGTYKYLQVRYRCSKWFSIWNDPVLHLVSQPCTAD